MYFTTKRNNSTVYTRSQYTSITMKKYSDYEYIQSLYTYTLISVILPTLYIHHMASRVTTPEYWYFPHSEHARAFHSPRGKYSGIVNQDDM